MLKYSVYIFMTILLSSCPEQQEQTRRENIPVKREQIKASTPGYALLGKAKEEVNEWGDYQLFRDKIGQFDPNIGFSADLHALSLQMLANLPEKWKTPPIITRLKVLQTRVGLLDAYLQKDYLQAHKVQNKYDDIILAWEHLIIILNEHINTLEKIKEETFRDLQLLPSSPTDGDSLRPDKP